MSPFADIANDLFIRFRILKDCWLQPAVVFPSEIMVLQMRPFAKSHWAMEVSVLLEISKDTPKAYLCDLSFSRLHGQLLPLLLGKFSNIFIQNRVYYRVSLKQLNISQLWHNYLKTLTSSGQSHFPHFQSLQGHFILIRT